MPFPNNSTTLIPGTQEGELGEGANIVLSTTNYEEGLKIGRFAKIDISGDEAFLSNMNGSVDPALAGVTLRQTTDHLQGSLVGITAENLPYYSSEPNLNYIRQGLVSVKLAAGSDTPVLFEQVYVVNKAIGDDSGNVTTSTFAPAADRVEYSAEFVKPVPGTTDIWLIRIV